MTRQEEATFAAKTLAKLYPKITPSHLTWWMRRHAPGPDAQYVAP